MSQDKRIINKICETLVSKRCQRQLTDFDEEGEEDIIKVPTSSGENIAIFIKKAENPLPGNPIVLYTHGDGGSIINYYSYYSYFCPYGVSFCVLDYRGLGFSDGDLNTAAINEAEDCITVINYLISQGYQKVSFFGYSLGAACGIYVASHFPDLVCLALDSPYIDHKDRSVFKISKRMSVPASKVEQLYPEACKIIKDEYGIDFLEHEQLFEAAAKIRQPIFIIHGKKDTCLPFSHSERLFETVKSEEKIFVPMPNGHLDFSPRWDLNLKQFIFILQHNRSSLTEYENK